MKDGNQKYANRKSGNWGGADSEYINRMINQNKN
jgi:hypothetical protein